MASQNIEYRTLPDLIERGTQALAFRDYPSAAASFNAILENYRDEPVWSETDLPSKILPLAGFAAHKADLHPAAIESLSEFLDTAGASTESELFARYTLAVSYLLSGNEKNARDAFAKLRTTAGKSPFRDLSLIREAQLSETPDAIQLLQELLGAPASQRLAAFAELELARLALETGDLELARTQVLNAKRTDPNYFLLATRSYLAAQIAEKLEAASPHYAVRCYQSVRPKGDLTAALKTQLEELQFTYKNLAPKLRTEQSMWTDHYQRTIASLESQLESLAASPDYADAIAIRKARCFARLKRPIEAWILLESIATSDSPHALSAHLDWIFVARSMQAWRASAVLAKAFTQRYPDNEYVPQTLFWIALAQLDLKSYENAIDSFQAVIDSSPNNELLASSHYYIGYSWYLLNKYQSALSSFRKAAAANPDSLLAGQAQIWSGICHFSSFELEKATKAFRKVLLDPAKRTLHPEASFREATCLYAAGKLEDTVNVLERWLQSFPPHLREPEVYLLLGDALSEQNRTSEALSAYQKVESADLALLHTARRKRAEIHLSSGKPQRAIDCLTAFESKHGLQADFAARHSLLLSDAFEAAGEPERAKLRLEKALDAFGNDLGAAGLLAVIRARYTDPGELDRHAENAMASESFTLAARYRVAYLHTQRQLKRESRAKRAALTLVSDFEIDTLPPEALAEAGKALLEIESLETTNYFSRILESYPNSIYIDEAYLGLAQFHHKQDEPRKALGCLSQIEQPKPASESLRLDLLVSLGLLENAKSTAESMLAARDYPPNCKAKALNLLGRLASQNGQPLEAYAYHQRVFTLYRGEKEEVANAYFNCARILSQESKYKEARAVLDEFLMQRDLAEQASFLAASELQKTLPETSTPSSL